MAAMKAYDELAKRLSGVEVDCEKAAMMAEPLVTALEEQRDEVTGSVRETKEALRVAQATLAPMMRLISGKVANLKGTVRNKLLELQARAEASQSLLEKAQSAVDETQSRAASQPILKQAAERLAAIEQILSKMRETEAPFLMGLETMPPEESADALSKMDKAAALAHAALADAHKYIALKIVEVGRLSENAAADARRELEKFKLQIDTAVDRVHAFQSETGKRKRANVVSVIKHRIGEAEEAMAKVKEAVAAIKDADAETMPETLERAMAAEVEAQGAVAAARRELQEKQTELRPQGAKAAGEVAKNSQDILKTKVRVNALEAELTKHRRMLKEAEERVKVGRSLSDLQDTVREAEADVERVSEMAKAWAAGEEPPEEESNGVAEAQEKLTEAVRQVEEKLQVAQGLELKELRVVFGRLQKAQAKVDQARQAALQLAKESSARIMKDATTAVKRAEQAVSELSTPTRTLEQLEKHHTRSGQVSQLLSEARKALTGGLEEKLPLQSKVEFTKLQLHLKAVERRGKTVVDSLARRMEGATLEATKIALDILRAAAKDEDGMYDPSTLFHTISGGDSLLSHQQLLDFLQERPTDPPLPADKASLAAKRLGPHGLTASAFANRLQNFETVIKEITITNEFEISTAKKVRKLTVGELVEVLSESRRDESLGLQRVQARAVLDGAKGWITNCSVGGTNYLAPAQKPYVWCAEATTLRREEEQQSAALRELKQGDVLELICGPREESMGSGIRVRGASCHEAAAGWLQVRDRDGAVLAKVSKQVYRCGEAIAMTDVADFANCSMVRRVEVGEALELLPDAEVQPSEGGARRKFRACRDGSVGWVTTLGSQGTAYVAPAPRHYICLQAAPIHAGLGAESAVVRVLMEGEAFAAFEEPRDVAGAQQVLHYSVRAMNDGLEGWISATGSGEVLPWSARYTVLRPVQLTSSFAANEAAEVIEVVRLLEADELVEATEPPAEDPSTGQIRVRCVALRDKAVGWATVREGGALSMRPASAAEASTAREPEPAAAPSTPPAGPQAPSTPPKGGSGKGTKRPAPPTEPPWGKGGGKRQKGKGWR
ncbi:unnamed protein product [Prorocentrum cordatum]|uniref:Uncharacterized protein n=1 Tax=Prorocentrum cordatum TaxID=2364126 RepID=A0ABN9W7Z2_9DINO|nr:unnamed protein product [Polarella glacialis]